MSVIIILLVVVILAAVGFAFFWKKTGKDCTLMPLTNTDCSGNKQTLSVDVSSNKVRGGKSCPDVLASEYPQYKFVKTGDNTYTSEIECNNFDVSGSFVSSCVGDKARTQYNIVEPSEYGKGCEDLDLSSIQGAVYDASYNIIYVPNNACEPVVGQSLLRYGFASTVSKQGTDVSNNLIKFYFNDEAGSNKEGKLAGFDIQPNIAISRDASANLLASFSDISNGTYIYTTDANGDNPMYFTKGGVISGVMNIVTPTYKLKVTFDKELTSSVGEVTMSLQLYNISDNTAVGEKIDYLFTIQAI